MENINVVNEPLTPVEPSQGNDQGEIKPEVNPQPVPVQPAPAGSRTDSELLLKSLQDEREKRKALEQKQAELEEELDNLKTSGSSNEVFSDEGKVLQAKIDSLNNDIHSLREERELERAYIQFPALKEVSKEFEEYRKEEHPRAKIESVAKLFLSEKGLLEPVGRKGLEEPTGGTRVPVKTGMTAEDVENLRKTNYKKYKEMVEKDQIKIIEE